MTLKQAISKCYRIANSANKSHYKYIKIISNGNGLRLRATDGFRLVKYDITIENNISIIGLYSIDIITDYNEKTKKTTRQKITSAKDIADLEKFKNKDADYPDLPTFKFTGHIDIELEPLKRFCKMYKDGNIDIKISGREFTLSYRDDEIKTRVLVKYIKGNIKYYRTRLNAKLLLEILPRENTIKIKVGKSGRDPISFDDQIIMPISIEA